MRRRDKVLLGSSLAALAGIAVLLVALLWLLWSESFAAEEAQAGDLAALLGTRTEAIIVETRDLLDGFDRLELARCSPEHLDVLQQAAVSRAYIRAIGHWRAAERLCSVGFLHGAGLRPPRADRIYDSGVLAWWPGPHTEVGGVQLFLMRFGDHDVAIDPRMLLEIDPGQSQRQAGLWVEGLRMAASPWDAELPLPEDLPVGLSIDQANNRLVSRFSHSAVLPIELVAIEPIASVWGRHTRTLMVGSGLGLLLVGLWLFLVLRYSRQQLSLETELKLALAAGAIHVAYQPVVELDSGRCVGAEALARWERDDGESVSPELFVPLAERAGLVQALTLAVLEGIIGDLRALLREAPELSINLNLSSDDLKSDRFGEALRSLLQTADLPAGAIKLEITERALVNNDTSRTLIREFRLRGHQVAVDDFGTGYSSLSYLETFELDVLKIDKSFVDAIGTGAATSHVIGHVIEMAKSLGLETVAEGVQHSAQAEWLTEHGVRYGQGYLFSKPLSAAAFLDYFRRNRANARPLQWPGRARTVA
jgi:sensor c-di-GMP phosphodiesterase-like protein